MNNSNALAEIQSKYPNCNLLLPAATSVQINPFYKCSVMEVVADTAPSSGDIFSVGKVKTGEDGKQKACDIYDNMTTYLWGTVKDALMMEEVSLENDNELVAQFTCRKYRLTSRGKMLLESKEEMKKRGIDSPDRADAVALSCYQKKTFNIGSLVD